MKQTRRVKKQRLFPYFVRGRLVGHFTREVIEELSLDVFEEMIEKESWRNRAMSLAASWLILATGLTVLILSLLAK